MIAKGTFDISATPEPPYHDRDGLSLARTSFDKQFRGDLEATGRVQMLAAHTPVETSAAYVALELIEGTLSGRKGSFAVTHFGVMSAGRQSQDLRLVPDSGTGELQGIAGAMTIRISEGVHHYELAYELPAARSA